MQQRTDPKNITIVYIDEEGGEHYQPLTDITESGTLTDPETGDDMPVVAALVA